MRAPTQDVISLEAAGTLDGLLQQRVARTPTATAYLSHDKLTGAWIPTRWEEVAAAVARCQASLAAEDLQPGDRVGIQMRNCKEWVYFEQAALGLGLVVVPFYPDDRPDSVAYMLEDAGVKVLLLQDSGQWKRLAAVTGDLPALCRVLIQTSRGEPLEDPRARHMADWLHEEGPALRERDGDPQQLATIVYTSGTTGRPKGVMLSHHNLLSVAHAALEIVEVYCEDVFLSFLPLSHTLERTGGYYLPMMAGSTVAYARSVQQLAEDLQTVRPTALIAVPRIFERVYGRIESQLAKQSTLARALFKAAVAAGWKRFESSQGRGRAGLAALAWPPLERLVAGKITAKLGGRLRLAVSGGAALPPPVARTFIGLGIPILQGYGLTETSPVISVNTPEDNIPTTVGRPLPGIEVTTGEQDELLVRSPGVMLGYWNNPEATAKIVDREGWLHTGDQVHISNGYLTITGRIKDILVLSNGEKVSPVDMEMAIILDPLFEQAMIIGEGRPYLTALLVLNREEWEALAKSQGLSPTNSASLQHGTIQRMVLRRVAEKLADFPGYAKVRRAALSLEPWTVENGLLTPTLKVKRNKVLETYGSQLQQMYC